MNDSSRYTKQPFEQTSTKLVFKSIVLASFELMSCDLFILEKNSHVLYILCVESNHGIDAAKCKKERKKMSMSIHLHT